MKKMKKMWAIMLVVMMTVLLAGCSEEGAGEKTAEGEGADSGGKKVIGVSLMTLQYEFFRI